MDPDLLLIIFGITFVVLLMIFFINPPEAWIKRFLNRNRNGKRDS